MRAYYGYTLSPNQLETNEGFLICRNVPISRIGDQDYVGTEIGLDDATLHSVHRKPEEVFSDAALASFEGKPVTDDHPPELLTPDTARMYEKGHAQNIRPGAGEWDGYVLADLHIHDRDLIEKIQSGKREISCGYECEYVQEPDGSYSQHKIRGNHIAVVDKGRAGKRAAILDADITQAQKAPERTESMKKNSNCIYSGLCQCRGYWRIVLSVFRDGLPAALPGCPCASQTAKLRVVPFCSFPHSFPIRGFP